MRVAHSGLASASGTSPPWKRPRGGGDEPAWSPGSTATGPQVVFSPRKGLKADGSVHDAASEVWALLQRQGYSEDEIPGILAGRRASRSCADAAASRPGPAGGASLLVTPEPARGPTRFADHARTVGVEDSPRPLDIVKGGDDFLLDLSNLFAADTSSPKVSLPPMTSSSSMSQTLLSQMSASFPLELFAAADEVDRRAVAESRCRPSGPGPGPRGSPSPRPAAAAPAWPSVPSSGGGSQPPPPAWQGVPSTPALAQGGARGPAWRVPGPWEAPATVAPPGAPPGGPPAASRRRPAAAEVGAPPSAPGSSRARTAYPLSALSGQVQPLGASHGEPLV